LPLKATFPVVFLENPESGIVIIADMSETRNSSSIAGFECWPAIVRKKWRVPMNYARYDLDAGNFFLSATHGP
jgi:hypothetical protein